MHEAEFLFRGRRYSIEPERHDHSLFVRIWECSETLPTCISETSVESLDDFERLFSAKCFDGNSFYEIESEVTVECVF